MTIALFVIAGVCLLVSVVVAGIGSLSAANAEELQLKHALPIAFGGFMLFLALAAGGGGFYLQTRSAAPQPYNPYGPNPYVPAPIDLAPAFQADTTGMADEFWAGVFGGMANAIENENDRVAKASGQQIVDALATLTSQAILASRYQVNLQPYINQETAWLEDHQGEFGADERRRVGQSLRRLEAACEAID